MSEPLWRPSDQRIAAANLTKFSSLPYHELHKWSIAHPEEFWSKLWLFCDVISDGNGAAYPSIGINRMAPPHPELGPKWFVGATLNFAENLLRFRDDNVAIAFWNEEGAQRAITYKELHKEVGRMVAALRAHGIKPGDRVAGYMPNLPETIIGMLAATSIGAIWSSCSPDFGVQGVFDRFSQIQPKVLICADGYRYSGKEISYLDRIEEVARRIPDIERIIVVPYRNKSVDVSHIPGAMRWDDFLAGWESDLEFTRLPFDHPVYIMYSSGTTGLPKCMVHGAGGTLLQHLKELVLHTDLKREDKIFYFTTCGWMMWNWLVSALAVGATVVLYDGGPLYPEANMLWNMAEKEGVTVFGTSAKYLALLEKSGAKPAETHNLSALRAILSTGSPLAAHSYDYVYGKIKKDLHLASISGGTDIVSCFALGNPTAAVYRGELQCRGLGMAVNIFDENGMPVVKKAGELVCTKPFPSMPVSFWNDPDGSKYHAAYFDHFPNTWRHGDWAEITENDGLVIYGRIDATLNPGGVRIGTAEIYRQVEQLPEVVESIAVGQEIAGDASGDVRIVLFVRLREGIKLDFGLTDKIKKQIRANTSPMHVPKKVVQVADIPRTISGKISEVAVREIIHGRPVKNTEALANPQSLELYRNIPEITL